MTRLVAMGVKKMIRCGAECAGSAITVAAVRRRGDHSIRRVPLSVCALGGVCACSQETFDEAVKENIEDLGMEPEEALERRALGGERLLAVRVALHRPPRYRIDDALRLGTSTTVSSLTSARAAMHAGLARIYRDDANGNDQHGAF